MTSSRQLRPNSTASYWPSQVGKTVQLGIREEAIHGEIRHDAWNRWFRESSTGDNGTVGEADRYAHFIHRAGVVFREFDLGKDTGRNLLGPGVYLLSEEDLAVAEAYAATAPGRVLQDDPKTSQRLLRNKNRKKLLAARPEKIQSLLDRDLIKNAAYDARGNPQEEARLREVVRLLESIRDGKHGKIVLNVDYQSRETVERPART